MKIFHKRALKRSGNDDDDSIDLFINDKVDNIDHLTKEAMKEAEIMYKNWNTKDAIKVAMKEAILAYKYCNNLVASYYSEYFGDGDGKEKESDVNNQEELREEHEITMDEFMTVKKLSRSSSILNFVSKLRKPVATKRTFSISNQKSNETDNSAAKEKMSNELANDSDEESDVESEVTMEELINMNDDELAVEHEAKGEESTSVNNEKSDEADDFAEKKKTSIVNDWNEPVEEHELTREECMTWSELTKEHEVTDAKTEKHEVKDDKGEECMGAKKKRGVSFKASKRRI